MDITTRFRSLVAERTSTETEIDNNDSIEDSPFVTSAQEIWSEIVEINHEVSEYAKLFLRFLLPMAVSGDEEIKSTHQTDIQQLLKQASDHIEALRQLVVDYQKTAQTQKRAVTFSHQSTSMASLIGEDSRIAHYHAVVLHLIEQLQIATKKFETIRSLAVQQTEQSRSLFQFENGKQQSLLTKRNRREQQTQQRNERDDAKGKKRVSFRAESNQQTHKSEDESSSDSDSDVEDQFTLSSNEAFEPKTFEEALKATNEQQQQQQQQQQHSDTVKAPASELRKRRQRGTNRASTSSTMQHERHDTPIIAIDEQQQQLLVAENTALHSELNFMVDEVRQTEATAMEIGQLLNFFTQNVSEQAEQIQQIENLTVESVENVERGNEQLRSAAAHGSFFRRAITFVVLVLTLALLFLDWFNN